MARPSLDELETRVARLSHELGSARRGQEYWYEKNRLLENAVRDALDPRKGHLGDALIRLAKRVPKNPRKKWRWRG